jgi:hypothetical protein
MIAVEAEVSGGIVQSVKVLLPSIDHIGMQRPTMVTTTMDKGEVCQIVVMVTTTADQEVDQ